MRSSRPRWLALKTTQIDVDGKPIRPSPGMNLTAEIKTGKRRLIEFLGEREFEGAMI